MALTLTESAKLSNDQLQAGVVDTIVQESPVLTTLPFVDVVGTAVRYNRENAAPSVEFRAVGDEWTEDTPIFTEVTTSLKILGGDSDVDNFLAQSRRDVNDLPAIMLEKKVKALAYRWEDTFIYGNATADPLSFDGMHVLTPAGQTVSLGSGSTPAVLSLAQLDAAVDKVKPGKPAMILMSKACRRRISTYMRANSSPVNFAINEFGHRVMMWDAIPIFASDFISDTEVIASGVFSAQTGGASTSIFLFQVGEDAMAGLKNGEMPAVENFDKLETKDASRIRVKAYTSLAVFRTLSVAKIDGISTGAVTA